MNYYPFDSRNNLYRSKIGAVAEGESLLLRILLHKDARVHDAFLLIRNDNSDFFEEIHLEKKEDKGDYSFYDCEITRSSGLYWYKFRYTSDYGEFFVTKTDTSLGIVSSSGNLWQQTVYDADFSLPEKFNGGIIYQIFPDRFYNSTKPKKDVPDDRFLVRDWRRIPEHRQNGEKCSLGNDYYGGDLKGICEKLPYLSELGVTVIYLNPIFEAHSNHRYNTADYMKIDPLLGDEEDLKKLCKKAKEFKISIILDGVFSHTGDDSIYFNKYGRYHSNGAYNSYNSPYHSWYKFDEFPEKYSSWWGIATLPETMENDVGFSEFITGEKGVIRHWLRLGVSGFRLDVADELPDEFLDKIRNAVKAENPDALLIGEVWEDASNKISYGHRRRFILGKQLDTVMNYPFANAIVDFVRGGKSSDISETVLNIIENYPKGVVNLLMNHIGTHDTMRIITRLSLGDFGSEDRDWQSGVRLSVDEYERAKSLLKLAAVIQYTLPGIPSLYYGDETGLEGFGDPFCRATYPWGSEDKELLEFYKRLGAVRTNCKAFRDGEFLPVSVNDDVFCFFRKTAKSYSFVAINRGEGEMSLEIPADFCDFTDCFGVLPKGGTIVLSSKEYTVLTK